ncbi:hypothetical protein CPAST_c11780 [Clostridium pasteurianum DSM 525 = ATCC 6013]|uniref:Lipoprotein n=1 Tax=Clostridium pasteurianum DSM 525 = ATCC 6013 TaxID=1262449 RepID=A0A0H3J5V2_CLOPA|nr:hypothetical protein [Clostridium pasteurianum]AJA47278.1 hypothetical protein CPAST_c11780 [Clostridium pasteurianum DSM 525 = ATCC 6013]AJA51266.1 hypothetical protein CLPA_c11780 [Clostridium pasteurianum DSM 525 = ATCC 6013]AOZ74620.1 hypothetical protein AQ983_05690 [Clostridium pasteurianum DSM 525 = ATCC 6013]AOZ78417.1 hypothetical protein AQ984_05680 [Clostridium pasteurianum]ELP57523.1 hypothetical protein F502_19261 [Clostridium pasteurianum DSM 525 = ATCC 6013]
MKKIKNLAVVIIVSLSLLFTACGDKLVSRSYVGTYKLHEVDGYYLGKGTNEDDKMEYIFQTEPIDNSDTLSDNIDVTDGVKIKDNYTKEEKENILKQANKSISKESMNIFKNILGNENTVTVFAASYKDDNGGIFTKYEYEIMVKKDKIKDFDKD